MARCSVRTCCTDPYLLPCEMCTAERPLCGQDAFHLTNGKPICDFHFPLWKEHRKILWRIRNIRPRSLESPEVLLDARPDAGIRQR